MLRRVVGGRWPRTSGSPVPQRLRGARALSPKDALRYAVLRRVTDPAAVPLHPRDAAFPLYARLGSSDLEVFGQIYVDREYSVLDELRDVDVVVDCGAYVGYSSAYFLSRFPKCTVIAVEPNPANQELLRRNLAPYGARVRVLEAAVWSHDGVLAPGEDTYRDGREWTFHVTDGLDGEGAAVRSVTMPQLLGMAGGEISILKMDVEGAEAQIFADDPGWLDAVNTLVIELHDESPYGPGTPVVERVMAERGFSSGRSGEVRVFRRPARSAASG